MYSPALLNKPNQKIENKKIEQELRQQWRKESMIIKILMIGSYESGKNMILNSLKKDRLSSFSPFIFFDPVVFLL